MFAVVGAHCGHGVNAGAFSVILSLSISSFYWHIGAL